MSRGEQTVNAGAAANPEQTGQALAAQIERARLHQAAGEFAAAEALCRRMLDIAPREPQVMLMLGQVMSAQGRHEDVLAVVTPLIERYPDLGPAHFCLGNALHSLGRHAQAAEHFRRTAELQPRFAGGHCNLGLALDQLGDRAGAIRAFVNALSIEPNLWQARGALGLALFNVGRPEDAIVQFQKAAALNPAVVNNHLYLGLALEKTGRVAESLPHYQRAVALEPTITTGWIGLGAALRALGRFAEAATAYEKALAIDPTLGVARHALATMPRQGAEAGELDRLRAILADQKKTLAARRAAGLAMAKVLDRAERYDEAFAVAVEAGRLGRAQQTAANIRYDHDAVRAHHDAVMRVFTPEFFAKLLNWGSTSELPVFIVGSFRTGTTLVEQICASHSQVHGAGELEDIGQIAADLRRTAPHPEHWTADLLRPFADRYLHRLAARAPGKVRVTDKMPDNIYQLGLIAALFARARVIFTHRDGRDTALSIFMQYFEQEISFATDLVDAGRRWHEAERMSAYWRQCLPLPMHHVQYEALIADLEGEARRLIDFLGLGWEPGCLEFHKTERAVRTASTWQVRQPLYDSSVGRWRHYAKHLEALCEAIGIDPQAPNGARPAANLQFNDGV